MSDFLKIGIVETALWWRDIWGVRYVNNFDRGSYRILFFQYQSVWLKAQQIGMEIQFRMPWLDAEDRISWKTTELKWSHHSSGSRGSTILNSSSIDEAKLPVPLHLQDSYTRLSRWSVKQWSVSWKPKTRYCFLDKCNNQLYFFDH